MKSISNEFHSYKYTVTWIVLCESMNLLLGCEICKNVDFSIILIPCIKKNDVYKLTQKWMESFTVSMGDKFKSKGRSLSIHIYKQSRVLDKNLAHLSIDDKCVYVTELANFVSIQ